MLLWDREWMLGPKTYGGKFPVCISMYHFIKPFEVHHQACKMRASSSVLVLQTRQNKSEISFTKHENAYVAMVSQSATQLWDKQQMFPKGKEADELFVR